MVLQHTFPGVFVEIFQMRLLSILSLQIFLRRSQHQFNTVQLVYFTGAWVVIYGNDVGLRIVLSQFLDHTFSYNVVWQAAKWLGADNVLTPLWISSNISPVKTSLHPSGCLRIQSLLPFLPDHGSQKAV